jgi:putative hydrolase of the HAD superfamily
VGVIQVFNPAETGYEKPHPQAFAPWLAALEDIENIWRSGDNLAVDIAGAESTGIPGILVRRFQPDARYYCETPQQI